VSEYPIKELREDDWQIFKKIRLKALASDPFVFGSTLAAESDRTEDQWREVLRSPKYGVFVLLENDEPQGMTGIVIDREDPTEQTAMLWGSWLAPEVRGKGLSRMLYESRIEWAREHPTVRRIVVSHRASNLSSKFANQAFGFAPTHVTEKVWNDGVTEKEFHYELIL
jgi:RimJ/RimL family protein N-acetyltransferase